MSQIPESLLEVERIDEVLKTPDPTQAVVVVQYRTARLPWVLLMGAIVIFTLIGGVVYYRISEGVRTEAEMVARDMLKRWEEQKRLEADQRGPIRPEPPITPASTSVASVPAQGTAVAAPAPSAGHSGVDTPKVEAIATTTKPVEGPAPRPAGVTSTSPLAAGPAVSPPVPSPRELEPVAVVKAPADSARSPFDDPDPTTTDPADTTFGGTASRTAAIAQSSPAATRPATDPPRVETAAAGVQPGVPSAPSPAPPSPPIVLPTEPPLPSREESERQFREEAALKKAERAHQIEEQEAEDRRKLYEERVQFHQELQEAVNRFGNQAGMEIDQLCRKFDYQMDPASFARARSKAWIYSKTVAWRVREVRKLGLPETVILNLLSDDLHAQLRKPNGPQNSNEVRVHAARLLLKCGLPSPEEAIRPPARPGRSTSPTNRRLGTMAPRAAALPR